MLNIDTFTNAIACDVIISRCCQRYTGIDSDLVAHDTASKNLQ